MSARGGPRARRRQGPRLARPGGQSEARAGAPCWRDAPAAGVTRETRARDPGPGAAAPSPDVPPAPALGPTSPDVWPQRWHLGGVQPHPPSGAGLPGAWSQISNSGRHCAPPASTGANQRATQSRSGARAARAGRRETFKERNRPRPPGSPRHAAPAGRGPPHPSTMPRNCWAGAAWREPSGAR